MLRMLLNIVLGFGFIYYFLPTAFYWIFGAFLVMTIFNLLGFYIRARLSHKLLEMKDKRVAYFEDVLKCIEFVKIRAMENYFSLKIFEKREKEIYYLKWLAFVGGISVFLDYFSPGISSLIVLVYYIYIASEKFNYANFTGFIKIFDDFKAALLKFSIFFAAIGDSYASIQRLNSFLNAEEIHQDYVELLGKDSELALNIQKGDFSWSKNEEKLKNVSKKRLRKKYGEISELGNNEELLDFSVTSSGAKLTSYSEFTLQNINLKVKRGEKVLLFGETGSGKSSLLQAILAEMKPENSDYTI